MSEYWKSTPKYWCKHCKAYVRDTKLERAQHDATPRHQGNLKRYLRDLHRGHEKEERDKDRAKQEVARLNGVVSGSPGGNAGAAETLRPRKPALPASSAASSSRQATAEERKKQVAQLAEMGVAVPQEFRGEMAMAGDWQTLSVTPINRVKEEESEDEKPDAKFIGVRKRKRLGDEEEDVEAPIDVSNTRKGWGSTFKSYVDTGEEDADLKALLSKSKTQLKGRRESQEEAERHDDKIIKTEESPIPESTRHLEDGNIKQELDENDNVADLSKVKQEGVSASDIGATPLDTNAATGDVGVIFKKRKPRNIRQKG
ncbi:MAG: hypothetical protein M1825_001262 [Sarcosagium campestre]|nr:MAG: hypothetical protein M1825_001262 [Sarcosagium campestre]